MQENLYAPPASNLVEDRPNAIILASRTKRFFAATIDGLISTIIVLPIMYFTGGFEKNHDGYMNSLLYTASIGLIGIIAFILIHGRTLSKNGQTLGKKIIGIKITDIDGNLPSIKKHILPRYAFSTLIPYIPIVGGMACLVDLLFIFGNSRRCVHDQVGKTIVINE